MPGRKPLSRLLAIIFALVSPLIDGAILEKRPAVTFADHQKVSGASCVPWPKCNVYFTTVNVYYWPTVSPNTACLSANLPTTSSLPGIPDATFPSVYIVFPSIRAWDGCNTVGRTFVDLTTSFAPGELSTVGLYNSTYSFNFGDLPCPPANVGWDPSKGPYAPVIAPPDFLFELDPAFAGCIPATGQGNDPPVTLAFATAVSGPGHCHKPGHCTPAKRALERAHLVPWAPQKTAEPKV